VTLEKKKRKKPLHSPQRKEVNFIPQKEGGGKRGYIRAAPCDYKSPRLKVEARGLSIGGGTRKGGLRRREKEARVEGVLKEGS